MGQVIKISTTDFRAIHLSIGWSPLIYSTKHEGERFEWVQWKLKLPEHTISGTGVQ